MSKTKQQKKTNTEQGSNEKTELQESQRENDYKKASDFNNKLKCKWTELINQKKQNWRMNQKQTLCWNQDPKHVHAG